MRYLLLGLVGFLLGGCAGGLTGTVSTAVYSSPPREPEFTVIPPDSLSLTDRNISSLIEAKLLEHGYRKARSADTATVAVLYRYSLGGGRTHVSSSPDFVWGGQKVQSSTTYPRFFQIVVVDLEKSKMPESVAVVWQGEIYSSGASSNMSILAGYFIDVLFENYGSTVTNKAFFKVIKL